MKKILILILSIIGICFSFCNADGIYHNSELGLISIVSGGNTIYTIQDKNLGAISFGSGNNVSLETCGNYYQYGNQYGFNSGNYTFSSDGFSMDLYNLYMSAGPGNYFTSSGVFYYSSRMDSMGMGAYRNYNVWGATDGTYLSTQGPCPDGFHLPFSFQTIKNSTPYLSSNNSFTSYLLFPYCGYISSQSISYGMGFYRNSVFLDGDKCSFIEFNTGPYDFSVNFISNTRSCFRGYSVRCVKNEVVEPDFTWSILTGDEILPPPSPKFKVNYGNTSYEYELEDNLSIYLKSPVIQSGNIFTYNGSTGINLFFNGGSQFYGKVKLYLDGYYRFSKNVFYPICN